MNSDEFWERVKALRGTRIRAASGPREFRVVWVSEDTVALSWGKGRCHLPRATLEAAYILGHRSNALLPAEFHAAKIANYDPVCVVGILNAIGADRE